MCTSERYLGSVEVVGDRRDREEHFNILYYTDTVVLHIAKGTSMYMLSLAVHTRYSELSSSS